MTVPKEQVMENAVGWELSSPFMGWLLLPIYGEVAPKAPEGLVSFTSPLAGEVGPKGRVGSGDMHFPSMGRLLLPIHGEVAPKAPEGLCQP